MGYGAAGGSVTSSKMAAKMAAILDFTKNSNLSGKLVNSKYFLVELYNMIQLKILLLLVVFFKFMYRKKVKNTHFYSKIA